EKRYDGRGPATCSGDARRGEVVRLPRPLVCRLFDVAVRVDPARQHPPPRRVDLIKGCRQTARNGCNPAVADADIGFKLVVRRDDPSATDHQIKLHACVLAAAGMTCGPGSVKSSTARLRA